MIKLKKCPFCGSNNVDFMPDEEQQIDSTITGFIWCHGCDFTSDSFYSEDIAAEKWNRRSVTEAMKVAISALRPVSRERVERMRGEWMFKPFYKGTSRGAIECQECKGAFEGSVEFNFCPNCGAPMMDEAVDMVMERLEALKDG